MRIRIILNLDKIETVDENVRIMKDIKSRTVFVPSHRDRNAMSERIAETGLRPTAQREVVYGVLLGKSDHPTADEVFLRAKHDKPDISMATVYNCLDALVKCGLVRQVTVDRGASRYCSNMREHAHFCCDDCGKVFDIDLKTAPRVPESEVPKGFQVNKIEISLHGRCQGKCPDCGMAQIDK